MSQEAGFEEPLSHLSIEDSPETHPKEQFYNFYSKTEVWFPVLVSEFGWYVIILIIVGLGFAFPRHHPAQTFTSQTGKEKWNSSSPPLIFTHATDVHLSKAEPLKTVTARLIIKSLKFYKPDLHILTGDMIDDYGKKQWPKIGQQVEEDWELFTTFMKEEIEGEDIIDIAGNHDMWALESALSKNNLFLKYSYTYNHNNTIKEEDFYCRKIVKHNHTFILINEYRFPSIHPPYIYWAHPTVKMLDQIEKMIEEECQECYVLNHYPVDHNWWIKSSKGHTFEEIMQSRNIKVILSGHFHPNNAQIIHHLQGGVEYIGIGGFQRKGFGIITIDNERFVYHNIHVTEPRELFFMSNPIPLEQISSHQIFNEKEIEVRVISYKKEKVKLYVRGSIEGELKESMILKNGARIYSIKKELEEGYHHIKVEGEGCNISRDFYIGEKYKGEKEVAACVQRGLLYVKVSSIPIYLCLMIIVFPFVELKWHLNNYLYYESPIKWIYIIILGPFLLRERMKKVPKQLTYLMFILLLYPLLLPNHFFKTFSGLHGYSFLCFINIGGKIMYDEWALHMTYFYLLTIILPATIFISGLAFSKSVIVYRFNLINMIVWLMGICVVNYRWVGESVRWYLLFVNPTFVIIPIIIQCFLYKYVYSGLPDISSTSGELSEIKSLH